MKWHEIMNFKEKKICAICGDELRVHDVGGYKVSVKAAKEIDENKYNAEISNDEVKYYCHECFKKL